MVTMGGELPFAKLTKRATHVRQGARWSAGPASSRRMTQCWGPCRGDRYHPCVSMSRLKPTPARHWGDQ